MTSDFARILRDATEAELMFVVVGGIAVIRHGVVRATRDVDLVVEPSDEATAELRRLAVGWDATFASGAPLDPARIVAGRPIPLRTRHGYVDVLPEHDAPLTFAEIASRADVKRIDGVPVQICSLADLVALKRLAAPPRDEQDLADLETVHGELPELPAD